MVAAPASEVHRRPPPKSEEPVAEVPGPASARRACRRCPRTWVTPSATPSASGSRVSPFTAERVLSSLQLPTPDGVLPYPCLSQERTDGGVPVIRTRIQLTEEQTCALKELAARKGLPVAELVRRAVDHLLRAESLEEQERRRRAMSISGRFHGLEPDLAVEHDRYLEEAYSS